MGVDMTVRVFKYDPSDNFYHEISLYVPRDKYNKYYYDEKGNKHEYTDKYAPVPVYSGRNTEMFDGMKDGDEINGYGYFPWRPVVLPSFEPEVRKELSELPNKYYYDVNEISLVGFECYIKTHPEVVDYEKDWGDNEDNSMKENPLKDLFKDICSYITLADYHSWISTWEDYKVVFYFDC